MALKELLSLVFEMVDVEFAVLAALHLLLKLI